MATSSSVIFAFRFAYLIFFKSISIFEVAHLNRFSRFPSVIDALFLFLLNFIEKKKKKILHKCM